MNKSPAFQFYPADFLSDPNTLIMSAEEIGVYWLLICTCWKQGGLPEDLKKLSQLARLSEKRFTKLWQENISQCFYLDGESHTFRHKRLDKESIKQQVNSDRRKAAAEVRWDKDKCKSNANASTEECKSNALHISSSSSTAVVEERLANASPKPARRKPDPKTMLPEDFALTDEMRIWANKEVPDVDIDRQLAEFITFWRDIATRNNRRTVTGWRATWQNRMREVQHRIETTGGKNGAVTRFNGNGNKPTPAQIIANRSYRRDPA